MSFYDTYPRYKNFDLEGAFSKTSPVSIQTALEKNNPSIDDFVSLLSLQAESSLEDIAQRANELTKNNFGRTIQLYTPLYLSNYCDNSCSYCGFNLNNKIERIKLTLDEVEEEAKSISSTGLKHILILTGESRSSSPVSYIKDCIRILKKYFTSISTEIYPLLEEEYAQLIAEGVDGLVIYQEVYDEELYAKLHILGPKKDYRFRLDAPERGARSKMRNVSIGVLLGLGEWRKEIFLLGAHAKYLQERFPDVDIGISVPRLQPQGTGFTPLNPVSDKNIAQIISAFRIFLPRASIALSTRENPSFREDLIPFGVTKISAGSKTSVGGHVLCAKNKTPQFEIQDHRSVSEIKLMLEKKGYQPVFKDWMDI